MQKKYQKYVIVWNIEIKNIFLCILKKIKFIYTWRKEDKENIIAFISILIYRIIEILFEHKSF